MFDIIRLLDEEEEKPVARRPLEPGEVARYGRRSVQGEGGLAGTKSVSDQDLETLDICEEFDLPSGPDDYYAEPPGYSGKAPYDGLEGRHHIHESLKLDDKGRRRVRPQLTRLVKDVAEGRKRAIVVWSLCRLWRSVRLCEHLLDLFDEHCIELYDRNGRVDYTSSKGRSDVVGAAVRYEAQRKEAKEGVERGLRRNRKRRKIASNPNCLGMRTAGTRSNKVHFIDEELLWVRRIFDWYVGDGEPRPRSTREVAAKLTDAGFRWPEDLRRQSETTKARRPELVTGVLVQRVLNNPRYIGYHPTKRGAYQCDAFLKDGEPIIPLELFARAKRRLRAERRIPKNKRADRAFASLILCGFDAVPLQCQMAVSVLAGGQRERYGIWRTIPRDAGVCQHLLPNIRDDVLTQYVSDELAPLVEAALRQQASVGMNRAKIEQLRIELCAVESDLIRADELSLSTWREDPTFAYNLRQMLLARRRVLQEELVRLESHAAETEHLIPRAVRLADVDPVARAEAIRDLLLWAAVVPSSNPKVRWEDTKEPARHPDQGRLLFAFVGGIYHTAVIAYGGEHPLGYRKRVNLLRPAEPHEALASVADLPDPRLFVEQLSNFRARRGAHFDVATDAVGYTEWLQMQAESKEDQ